MKSGSRRIAIMVIVVLVVLALGIWLDLGPAVYSAHLAL